MKSFATSICPIKKSSRLEYEASPRYPRAIPAWQVGLRHGDLAYRCFRAISAWRSSHLSALRHGDPAQRCLRGIPAWRTIPQPISKRFLSGVITGLRHGDPSYSHLSGILAWQSVLLTGLRHGHPAYRPLRGRLPCAVKAFGPHRGSEYALHLPGTAFSLLGVLLEGPLGDRHRLPPPRTVPHPVSNCLQIDLRECFDTAPRPTGTSEPSPRGEGVF